MEAVEASRQFLADTTSCDVVEKLLSEIYDHMPSRRLSDLGTDSANEWRYSSDIMNKHFGAAAPVSASHLATKDLATLRSGLTVLRRASALMSSQLVRQLKRRDRLLQNIQKNYTVTTAAIQAGSLKRSQDAQLRFSLQPLPGESAFAQWKDAMSAVARLPAGIPTEFRKKVWLTLAEQYLRQQKVDWAHVLRFTFNDRQNPDDNELGNQIVKDLHRTGCAGFGGESEQSVLKRVLLAYARWNKKVGYCQGFNVLAAVILEVVERDEHDALKMLIFIIDHVMPEGYFTSKLRGLAVDMAVFRDLLHIHQAPLARHLDKLQKRSQLENSNNNVTKKGVELTNYEPPLVNMFMMQWLLTLFATCLPSPSVLRLWDCVLLDGSGLLIKAGLHLWATIAKQVQAIATVDEFYSRMSALSRDFCKTSLVDEDKLVADLYAPFKVPSPTISELREKYKLAVSPFQLQLTTGGGLRKEAAAQDEINCFGGICVANTSRVPADWSDQSTTQRMTLDIKQLMKNYNSTIKAKQKERVILTSMPRENGVMARVETAPMVNHLKQERRGLEMQNVTVMEAPKLVLDYPRDNKEGTTMERSAPRVHRLRSAPTPHLVSPSFTTTTFAPQAETRRTYAALPPSFSPISERVVETSPEMIDDVFGAQYPEEVEEVNGERLVAVDMTQFDVSQPQMQTSILSDVKDTRRDDHKPFLPNPMFNIKREPKKVLLALGLYVNQDNKVP